MDWIKLAYDWDKWQAEILGFRKYRFPEGWSIYYLLTTDCVL